MGVFIDLTGEKFGKLTVIKRSNNNKRNQIMWLCLCNCGNEKIIVGASLRAGLTNSCGCLNVEVAISSNTKHGHNKIGKKSRTYSCWDHVIQRCNNPNNKNYHNYGGRGITVCKRWLKFENFLKDMGQCPSKKHSIDRINNNLGYYKRNCKWSFQKEQCRNMRKNRLIPFNGKKLCVSEWSEITGIGKGTIVKRLNSGWSIKETLTIPVKKRG